LVRESTVSPEEGLFEAQLVRRGSERRYRIFAGGPQGPMADLLGDPTGKWGIAFETTLDSGDPATAYTAMLRELATAFRDAPGIFDPISLRLFTRSELEGFISYPAAPVPDSFLWRIESVSSRELGARGRGWLHTHGLWRCGRLELELVGVPPRLMEAAAQLLGGVGELLLDEPPPPPDRPLEVAPGIGVLLVPWETVVIYLRESWPGSLEHREPGWGGPHSGPRLVLCGVPLEGKRKRRLCPRRELEILHGAEEVALRRSPQASEREARRARATWPEFVAAAAGAAASATEAAAAGAGGGDAAQGETVIGARGQPPRAEFFAKIGFPFQPEKDDGSRELLWVKVRKISQGSGEGEIENQPVFAKSLRQGQVVSFDASQISDWLVRAGCRLFGPHQAGALRELRSP
jgi:hypothetical protein